MMRAFSQSVFIFVCSLALLAQARAEETSAASLSEAAAAPLTSEYSVKVDSKESRFSLSLYAQMSQFTFQGRALLGNALELAARYAISPKIAATLSCAQALDAGGGITILYTDLHGSAAYALSGSFVQTESSVSINGQDSFQTQLGQSPTLSAEVGVEQLLFNGTTRIVPGTGMSFGLRYDRSLWKHKVSAIARYGMLIISETPTTMMTGGLGIVMQF